MNAQRCPCCGQVTGTCNCEIEVLANTAGELSEWCITHHRAVIRENTSPYDFIDDEPPLPPR